MQTNVESTPHLRGPGEVITVGSVAAILFATLLPELGRPIASHLCLVCGTTGGVDAILNVLLFAPLGVGFALRGIAGKRAALTMCALSILIESVQLFFIPGRDATLGDVVTNTLGGALGFAATRYARVWLRPSPLNATLLMAGWATLWLAIQLISSIALLPSIPGSQYYGQLSPVLGNFAIFRGRVLSASIGDVAITNTALPDSRGVQRAVLSGARVVATVVPGSVTPDIAPVMRVVDSDLSEIALVAQKHTDLLFAIRSGAATFRLRPPVFALPRVFPIDGEQLRNAQTLALSGQHLSREVRIAAQDMSGSRERLIPISASLGWTLVLPWQWVIEGTRTELVLGWIWIFLLTLPFAFWGAHVGRQSRYARITMTEVMIWSTGAVILYIGLGVIPRAFGLSSTPIGAWLAALASVLIGAALAVLARTTSQAHDGNGGRSRRGTRDSFEALL